ncbi:RICIN domain-containing protein [Streptomyces sp. NPDC056452]|uniref:RICIN domain-containing protein n=1 Tax=Streptomyces sp. NPDC056452 TaxID=3345821 RepID=UPI0036B15DC5
MRKFTTVLTALLFSLSLGMLNTGTAQAVGYGYWSTLDNGYYLGAPLCATPEGNSTANGAIITQWSCTGSDLQQWMQRSDNRIVHKSSGKCLTPSGDASGTNGAVLTLWTCNSSAASQLFVVGYSHTFTQHGGKCITPKGNSWANGAYLTLWTCAEPAPPVQRWN